ncbi:MAG: hypothetical protein P4L56_19230 [Candidatus Sulfopaludibacter sp.]|nr:hypothetical protein [Candidatus Sulfopaludibacter sp.]
MSIEPKNSGASASAPTWGNWSGNLVHSPPGNGANYYFRPKNLVELKSVLADAVAKGVTVRASGQRHSQPPLVADDNRGAVSPLPTTYLVDMSCYADLGPEGRDLMVLGPGPNQVTVNPGAREDDLDAFLTRNNLMLETVTAGGFFSIGGMTAVTFTAARWMRRSSPRQYQRSQSWAPPATKRSSTNNRRLGTASRSCRSRACPWARSAS